MIIRFSAGNFRSIRERQELTLVATSLKDSSHSLITPENVDFSLLPVAAIYGANASGKTNVIKALQFLSQAVAFSQRHWDPSKDIPRSAFALGHSPQEPSSLEIEFFIEQTRYRYGFSLDSKSIHEEWLYAYPNGKQQQWFSRAEVPERNFSFGRNLPGEKNRAIQGLTRPNSLYLSAAAQNNHEALLPVYEFLVNGISFSFDRTYRGSDTSNMCSDEKYHGSLLHFLKGADLGIDGVRASQVEWDDKFKRAMSAFLSAFKEIEPTLADADLDVPPRIMNPVFQHRGGESSVEFAPENESAGTMAYFSLLGPILKSLESGTVLCVDDLDSNLHPLLALDLVRLFNNRTHNAKGAQLIFNTHDTNLLDNALLRRDQVWFTEKDSSGATHLYPLSDFRPRKDENLKRGYLQGRYGAIPFVEYDLATKDSDR